MKTSIQELRARLNRANDSSSQSTTSQWQLENLTTSHAPPKKLNPALQDPPIAEFLKGQWKQRPSGSVLTVEKEFPGQHLHGGIRLDSLYCTEPEVVCLLGRDRAFADFHPENTLFMDTETTGLAGGAGTYVFCLFSWCRLFRSREVPSSSILPSCLGIREVILRRAKRSFLGRAYMQQFPLLSFLQRQVLRSEPPIQSLHPSASRAALSLR